MASVAGRKKSIVSSAGLQIDNPVANNTLLNKAASQSTSLYQQCSSLRNRLMRIRGFAYYFSLTSAADSRQSTDPVTQLWDLFSFGIPLCYIFDKLPAEEGFTKINNSGFNQEEFDSNPDKAKKRAIALFAMQIRTNKVTQAIPGCEEFTVTDLWDRNSTDGLVKVINTVTAIVHHLPPDAFETFHPSNPSISSNDPYESTPSESSAVPPANAQETARNNIIREMVETERKYVQDLEIMQSLIKACIGSGYQHFDELKQGSDAAKRITDKINEAQRRAENELTVKSLYSRIDDWKGHHLENFGELLLDDIFVVTKSDIDREYHVFLFEKIILCCKEALQQAPNGRAKVGKSNSILKKQATPPPIALPGGVGQPVKKNTPLLLKGRIFLGNVTQAIPTSPRMSTNASIPQTHYPLAVWWKGDDDLEYFTLRCRREDQMRQWEAQINRLIKESAQRRASERNFGGITRIANSTNPTPQMRASSKLGQSPYMGTQSVYSSTASSRGGRTPYGSDEQIANTNSVMYGQGPQGYPPHDGFEFEPDDDDYEDYPPSSSYASSGRGTPVGNGYRRNNALSMPPERDHVHGYDRPRAQTEDQNGPVMAQWRNNHPPVPPSQHHVPSHPSNMRPHNPRMNSTMSMQSYGSDSSYVSGQSGGPTGLPGGPRQRPPLRSQFSSTKLKSVYDNGGEQGQRNSRSGAPKAMTNGNGQPIPSRSRSASQPIAYVPKNSAPPPPLPTTRNWGHERSHGSTVNEKRGSGSSQSTGDSSDYSPNSSSPVTPFGSSESSLGGVGIRSSRSQYFDGNGAHGHHQHHHEGPPVKVKVHFHEDIFVIQVARSTEYDDLVERVGRKIRLCGPRRDDGPLRVKYKDEDGDMVSLGSTEDVQMAFEQYRPGGQVTLFVT
ncbi:hypothetical protein H0H81_011811 [Sphagnurus paluster]|uniref:PB1 domain-containing protein n=1 Tax=Sphagnurus paluster TaxID=117069 RepID=A0A9P7GNI6_9AGAR|nr:hypothetical protein H0H81_011811 [Sphagnurus paluster]